MGPLLFLLYIKDLPDYIPHGSKVNLFADDNILYRTVNSIEDSTKLQNDFNCIQIWENDWMMSFQCQTIHITNKRRPLQYGYTIHGQTVATVASTKYLGITLYKSLSWKRHIDSITKRANNMCFYFLAETSINATRRQMTPHTGICKPGMGSTYQDRC